MAKSKSSPSPFIHEIPDSPNKPEKWRKERLDAIGKNAVESGLKAQQNRARMVESEKELTRKQGIKDPTVKMTRHKSVSISKPVSLSEPIVQ